MATSTVNSYVHPGTTLLPEASREFPKKLVIRSQNRIFLQTVSEIDYLTAAANYVHIYAGGQMFRIRSTINAIEQKLDPQSFGRVHRCTIVNFGRVKEFRGLQRGDYLLTLGCGAEVKMSRRHREQIEKIAALGCAAGKHLVKYGRADQEQSAAVAANSVSGRSSSLAQGQ
jgi:DNA-binding LytR/AlgR family response regulator